MASYYVNLPAPQVPRNAMLDFSGINDAIDSYQAQQNRNRQFGMQEQQLGMDRERLGLAKDTAARQQAAQERQWKREDVQMFGQQAAAVDRLQGPQRAQAWQAILREHGGQGLSPEEMDPVTGPKLMMAQAGQFRDPIESQLKAATLAKLQAEASALGQKNSLNEAIAGMISGMGQPAAPQAGPSPQLIPQSNALTPPDNAMLIRTQAGGSTAPSQQPDLIDTPLGRMPREQASRMGMALALGGKGDAGKMLSDAASVGRLGKEGQNELDKKMIAASDNLTNLASIKMQFRPEFQQIETRLGMAWTAFADRFRSGQKMVKPEDRAMLEQYSAFRSDAFDAFNNYIKSITGAAMTEAEAQRIMKAFPAPGEGIFDGDSPTQFKAKLDQAYDKARAAVARYNYARNNGKDWQYIGLNQMASIVRSRGNAISNELRKANPNMDPATLRGEVTTRLKQEFGI